MASDLTVGLDMIAAATVPTKPSARLLWGVVTSTASPVQVVLENDASATSRPVSGNAAGPVAAGDRVLLARQRRRLTIISNPSAQARLVTQVASLTSGLATATREAGGRVTITPSAANTATSIAVTFPTGLFSASPEVMVTPYTTAGAAVTACSASSITATGCLIWLTRTNTTPTILGWTAKQY